MARSNLAGLALAGLEHEAPPDPADRPPTALFRLLLPSGTRRSGPLHVADAAAFAVVDGSTPEQARTRLNEVIAWWEASRVWR